MELAFIVWAIDFVANAEFFGLSDFFLCTILFYIVFSFVLLFYMMITIDSNGDEEEAKENIIKFFNKSKALIIPIFVIGCFGSVLNGIIPDNKNTVYLMAGAYFTQSAYEECGKQGTACQRIMTKLEAKINKAIDDIDAEKVIETTKEAVKE